MNKVILMGRLARDPEVRYGGANSTAVARYTLAVDRRFRRDGEPGADFFNCVSFGKQGEFVEKYLRKGTKILIEGELRNNNYTGKDGQKVYSIDIVTAAVEFAESRRETQPYPMPNGDGFTSIPEGIEEELPFT